MSDIFKNKKGTVEKSIIIDASAELVFKSITDWRSQSKWMPLTHVDISDQKDNILGSEITAITGISPLGIKDTMVITTWNPPYECSVVHTGKVIRGSGTFKVQPIKASSSKFTWSEQVIVPFGILGWIFWPIIKLFSGLATKVALKRFKNYVTSI